MKRAVIILLFLSHFTSIYGFLDIRLETGYSSNIYRDSSNLPDFIINPGFSIYNHSVGLDIDVFYPIYNLDLFNSSITLNYIGNSYNNYVYNQYKFAGIISLYPDNYSYTNLKSSYMLNIGKEALIFKNEIFGSGKYISSLSTYEFIIEDIVSLLYRSRNFQSEFYTNGGIGFYENGSPFAFGVSNKTNYQLNSHLGFVSILSYNNCLASFLPIVDSIIDIFVNSYYIDNSFDVSVKLTFVISPKFTVGSGYQYNTILYLPYSTGLARNDIRNNWFIYSNVLNSHQLEMEINIAYINNISNEIAFTYNSLDFTIGFTYLF
jgi:hypothetical protein